MNRGRRPTITRVGQVHRDGNGIALSGWHFGLCAANCNCHRHPFGKHIVLLEDVTNQRIGIVRFGGPCGCCQNWAFDELDAIVRELADVAALHEAG